MAELSNSTKEHLLIEAWYESSVIELEISVIELGELSN